MRRLTLPLALAGLLAGGAATASAADSIPAPKPIVTTIGRTPMVELSDGGGGLPYLGSPTSYNAGDLVGVLTQFHDTGVYARELRQIDGRARSWLRREVRTRTGKLALVLDIDETSLSNYSAILADKFTYGPNSQAEAVNEVGKAIPPTLALYRLAQRKGVRVFFITGRPEAQRAPTADNLRREGFTTWKQLTLKPPVPAGQTLTTVAYKSGARAAIEKRGFRIVANVGDQYSDLAGGHADRAFKLPNPFYFLP